MSPAFVILRLRHRRLPHLALAGAAWGLSLAAGLTAMDLARCGAVCLDQAATTAVLCMAVGMIGIGPLAALQLRR